MTQTLVIVESPAKAKTIKRYLGKGFSVTASMGHVRDLPKSQFGIDVDHDFEVKYINIRGKGPLIKELRKEAKKADRILLASDPDREGEAIAWHLQYILGIDPESKCRISFNEITKDAVKNAIKEPRVIDMNRVDAQQARRVLDRIVGYKLSPLLWHKVKKGLSAGRVQSVALRLICEREREILDFIPEEYWSLEVTLKTAENKTFQAKLAKKAQKKLPVIPSKEAMDAILAELSGAHYEVAAVKTSEKQRKAPLPFTTSVMQQEANKKLNFTARKTMRIAQTLYEGVTLGRSGSIGLITYMRTDSTRVSEQAKEQAKNYIIEHFGEAYYTALHPSGKKAGNQKVQDAHEAIRPTYIDRDPESVRQYLSNDEYKLYKLIWSRFIASQMAPAKFAVTNAEISAGDYTFTASYTVNVFPGYQLAYDDVSENKKEKELPALTPGETLTHVKNNPEQHFTQPPARYTEASLVKTLEEKGIGRPSTYASIIETITARNYVYREKKSFYTTEIGELVNELLVQNFGDIINVNFTAQLESDLDLIEEGERQWKDVIRGFYGIFSEKLAVAEENIGDDVKIEDEITDILCEKCGRPFAIKMGRYGKFLACTGFPECRNARPLFEEVGVTCPKCGQGHVVKRRSKKGRVFYGCDRYPDCDFVTWEKPTGEICPQCGEGYVVEHITKKGAYKVCSNKNCNYKVEIDGENNDAD
ncbi:MAG: type I DNA topoisomerase [Peptococcaceae bacterium]|nr:type I DNA topoisomerase [Peptococcaceae bacterium]